MARLVCLALLLPHANSQMDGLPKKAKPSPIDGDIKYIRCQTCELMVAKALEQAKAVAAAEQPKPQQKRRFQAQENLGGLEGSIEDIVTSICDSESVEGKWMSNYDIVKRGAALKLENQVGGDVVGGHCKRECRTIEKACAGVLGSVESELGELLLDAIKAKTSAGVLGQRVCTKMARVCKKGKTPEWPEGKIRRNEEFKPKTKKDQETEELMATLGNMPGMEGQGLSMLRGDELDLGDAHGGDGLKDEL
ncbi:hypothetical protein AB1Y20_019205 [Prymnesium parvum]|uniref:Saposin B-type domain-containing protein n=1 Tax=Prymnesium parvum TaxID=97485 RepID=A0AB34JTT4_PRYPA